MLRLANKGQNGRLDPYLRAQGRPMTFEASYGRALVGRIDTEFKRDSFFKRSFST
jgi:hypothetical protein